MGRCHECYLITTVTPHENHITVYSLKVTSNKLIKQNESPETVKENNVIQHVSRKRQKKRKKKKDI